MKNTILISIFTLAAATLFAQNIWTGNTPGRETDWLEARNWSRQRVPGWNDNVLIPHLWHNNYPVVNTSVPAIAHLEVEGGARLKITSGGYLPIDGSSAHNSGILLLGNITNEGMIAIKNTAREAIAGKPGNLATRENGHLTSDGILIAYEFRPDN